MEARAASQFSPFSMSGNFCSEEDQLLEVKKGPWTEEEDALLLNCVNVYGEGRWNSIASFSGLKRTGKSCRLRWLNYLRPDVRRGNITLQEQLLILELHSRWGNRWSKIAQYLPGRTDNEIKNYWRTRVQKQAKQMKCDVNSKQFRDAMRFVWMPRLRERIESSSANNASSAMVDPINNFACTTDHHAAAGHPTSNQTAYQVVGKSGSSSFDRSLCSEMAIAASSSDLSYSGSTQGASLAPTAWDPAGSCCTESSINGGGSCSRHEGLIDEGDLMMENLWYDENIWFLQQQLFDD
ncbi:hypothetical protein SAY87_004573 [Trapa incisa]|uniref:Uncharacterized protein n=1 Tax=Trapa incisa TaxID=236973 RepID=A0AAN7JP88_9MYRT|nr:hypothetical protein SAY87_004573 [Trapa incisa]